MTESQALDGVFGSMFWAAKGLEEKALMLTVLSHATKADTYVEKFFVPAGSMITTWGDLTALLKPMTTSQVRYAVSQLSRRGLVAQSQFSGGIILTPSIGANIPILSVPSEKKEEEDPLLKTVVSQPQVATPPPVGRGTDKDNQKRIKNKNNNLNINNPSLNPSPQEPGPEKKSPVRVDFASSLVSNLLVLRSQYYPNDVYSNGDKKLHGKIRGICHKLQGAGATEEVIFAAYELYLKNHSRSLTLKRHPWEIFYTDFGRYVEALTPPSENGMALAKKLEDQLRTLVPELFTGNALHDVNQWARDFDDFLTRTKKDPAEIAEVIAWYPNEEFLSKYIRDALSFIKHYPSLVTRRAMLNAPSSVKIPHRKNSLNAVFKEPPKYTFGTARVPGQEAGQ